MHRNVPTLVIVSVLAMGATMPILSAEDNASLERRGAGLLTANCVRCHAIGRSGASSHPAAPPFRTLSGRYPIDGLAEALAEGLLVGHPDMPEFKFEPGDIGAILAYLKSIQER